jgi:uncharacterized protein (DUF849 family)
MRHGVNSRPLCRHLPITPDEITEHGIGAAEAGAAILHPHARDPTVASSDAADHGVLPRLNQATDAILNISTGGSAVMTLDQRLAAPKRAEPEMCSLNMGTMNFALYQAAERLRIGNSTGKAILEDSDDLVL